MRPIAADDVSTFGDCYYTVIVAAAKRARQLIDGAQALVESESNKPLTIALKEINQGKVRWIRTKEGIK